MLKWTVIQSWYLHMIRNINLNIFIITYFREKYIKYKSDVMQTELEAAIIASSSPGDQVTRVNINYIN